MVHLELYRAFCAVAVHKSFSEAARALFLTQSAVSQSIRQLEEQLGRPLFVRGRRGVTLTREGELLYAHAGAALEQLRVGEERLERMRRLEEGELSIGAGDTISGHLLLPLLEQFHRLYPAVRLKVINRTSGQAVELLKTGKIDLAFANLPLGEPALEIREVLTIHDIFVASEKFAALRGRALTLAEVARCHLIMLETTSNSRRVVDDYFLQNEVRLQPEIELGAHDLLLKFARIGLGVACVIQEFSAAYLQPGELFALKLQQPVPPRAVGLCTLRDAPPGHAAQRFVALLEARAKQRAGVEPPVLFE